ncbi:MAG: helix-turn-helix transcriptional regulator [Deltaproteobacteria bacterium]|nr:helix-turn-helix transcriptional regulator [Deltaproteobacteria bacterium]
MNKNENEKEGRLLQLAIAERIREKRTHLGYTLGRLAKITGLSKGYLSQIENNEKIPPLNTLSRIAFGLQESLVTLLTGELTQQNIVKVAFGRARDRRLIVHKNVSPHWAYEAFGFNKQDRLMDAYIITLDFEFPSAPLMHIGQEFTFTLEGEHEFFYDGQTYRLEAGDAIYFDSDRPHMGRSLGHRPARLLNIFCNPFQNR